MNKESVMALLAEVNDENSGRDLVSAGSIREVGIHEDSVSVDVRLGYPLADNGADLAASIKTRLESDPGLQGECQYELQGDVTQGAGRSQTAGLHREYYCRGFWQGRCG